MKIVPYVSIEGRTFFYRPQTRSSLRELGSKLSDKFEKVYVADRDGISRNRPQLDVVQGICDELPTLYEGGVRFAQNVIDMLITGAERAVVGTATLVSLNDLRGAFKLSDNITLKVDFRDGIVSFDPSIAGRDFLALAQEVRAIGVVDMIVPKDLAAEAGRAKSELGFSLGVFASVSDRSRMESIGADYIVSEDFGSLVGDE
jgi:uncharacterized protein related to proFAR isomerase